MAVAGRTTVSCRSGPCVKPSAMKSCPACGAENDGTARFCLDCGETFDGVVAEPSDPWLGRMVAGRFRIIRKLGDGGMGEVYLAEQLPMGREIALKVLRLHLADDPQAVERFQREAQAASQLAHQHTITVYDFGQDEDGTLFLAMEFLKGQPLDEVLDGDALPPERVIQIMAQICGSLEEAHERGMVHRDLKPENIFLTERGREGQDYVKVLDFGIAKVTQSSKGDKLETITRAGAIFGTPQYMSPEQIRGEELDARSDVYALGVILYEMISGHLPFSAGTVMELLTQHLNAAPDPISVPAPNGSALAMLEATALRALSKDPAARQPSARAFLEDLMAAMPNLTLDSMSHLVPATAGAPAAVLDAPAPTTGGNSLVVVMLAAFVAAGAAGAFFFMGAPGGGAADGDVTPAFVDADQDTAAAEQPAAAADAKPAEAAAADAKPAEVAPAPKEISEEEAKKIEAEAEAEAKAAEAEEKAAEKGGEMSEAEAKAIAAAAEAEAKAAEAEAKAAAESVKAAEAAEKTKAAEEKAKGAEAEKAEADAAKAEAEKKAAEQAKAAAEQAQKAAEAEAAKAKSDADKQAAEAKAKAAQEQAKAAETARAAAEKAAADQAAAAKKLQAEVAAAKAEVAAAKAEAEAANAIIEEAKKKEEEAKKKAAAAKKRQRVKNSASKVFISTKKRGARVYVDGKFKGTTPLKSLLLKPGKHKIELRRGKQKKSRKVNVRAGRVLRVKFNL